MSSVLKLNYSSSEEFMLDDLWRSGLAPADFPIPPVALINSEDGVVRYRLKYTADYYKDRYNRKENKYIGPKGVTPPLVFLGGDARTKPEVLFAEANVTASVEGLKKSVLFEIVTGLPTAVLDSCWGFVDAAEDGESRQIRIELLEVLAPDKTHLVIMDGDWLSKEHTVGKALASYAIQLEAIGVRAIFPDFGFAPDGTRRGFDDWWIETYTMDRDTWPKPAEALKAILALPRVPVDQLEASARYALGSADLFNNSHVDFSDRGNATLFLNQFGRNNIRYLTDTKQFAVWSHGQWTIHEKPPLELTNLVANLYYRRAERYHAIAATMEGDKKEGLEKAAAAMKKWGQDCSSIRRREHILEDISARAGCQAKWSSWDADHDVLATIDGKVIDLLTGAVRAEVQTDFISKRTTVGYDGKEPTGDGAERMKAFVREITALKHGHPAPDRERWLQRRLGAALFGRNSTDALEIWHGDGANGKSVLAGVVQAMLGDYAVTIPPNVVMSSLGSGASVNPEAPTPLLMMAIGKRVIFMAETRDTQYLNEPLVKQMTGGDKLNARGMYRGAGSYDVTFTPVLLCNAEPQVAEGDKALWDRLAPLGFKCRWKRPERLDKDGADEVEVEAEAGLPMGDEWLRDRAKTSVEARRWLLWWAVVGAKEFAEAGCGVVPADVVEGHREYKRSQNKYARFMEDAGLEFAEGERLPIAAVYESYMEWCRREGLRGVEKSDLFSRRFTEQFKGKVRTGVKVGKVRGIEGVQWTGKKFDINGPK